MKRSHIIFPEMAHQPEGSFWNAETGKTLRLKYGSRGEPRGLVLLVEPISEARASVRCRGRINAPRRAVPPTHPPQAAVTKTPGPGRARTPNQHSDLTQETPRAFRPMPRPLRSQDWERHAECHRRSAALERVPPGPSRTFHGCRLAPPASYRLNCVTAGDQETALNRRRATGKRAPPFIYDLRGSVVNSWCIVQNETDANG